jgi:hypothetical protein
MFASNFLIKESQIRWIRGRENVKEYTQSKTVKSGNDMTNVFCNTCGGLMWRYSSAFKELLAMRVGIVDDLHLHETKLRPQLEQFVETRVEWLEPIKDVKQIRGMLKL